MYESKYKIEEHNYERFMKCFLEQFAKDLMKSMKKECENYDEQS